METIPDANVQLDGLDLYVQMWMIVLQIPVEKEDLVWTETIPLTAAVWTASKDQTVSLVSIILTLHGFFMKNIHILQKKRANCYRSR